jgi:hypothetical protein
MIDERPPPALPENQSEALLALSILVAKGIYTPEELGNALAAALEQQRAQGGSPRALATQILACFLSAPMRLEHPE